jgi:DNA-binding transcriptional LysR family regulator
MLRFPGAREHYWTLNTPEGPRKFEVSGPFDSDDGDVITGWALAGRGITLKPRFDVEPFIRDGRLKIVMPDYPALAGAACRRLPAQELSGPQGAAAARLHGRALPAHDPGDHGGKVRLRTP